MTQNDPLCVFPFHFLSNINKRVRREPSHAAINSQSTAHDIWQQTGTINSQITEGSKATSSFHKQSDGDDRLILFLNEIIRRKKF